MLSFWKRNEWFLLPCIVVSFLALPIIVAGAIEYRNDLYREKLCNERIMKLILVNKAEVKDFEQCKKERK